VDGRPAERKLWTRLRNAGLRRSKERVHRLMREHDLPSPHRTRPRPDGAHERSIITDAPNVMGATDGTQIGTVRDGKVWLFATVEHWNAGALGVNSQEVVHPGRGQAAIAKLQPRTPQDEQPPPRCPSDGAQSRADCRACAVRPDSG
jgi:hypothetical protein